MSSKVPSDSRPVRSRSAPRGIAFADLFAGTGGFRLALQGLGARCVFSSEWDRFARQTYEANFGEEPAGDLRQIAAERIPHFDLLCAGFPCQPFSLAGVSKKNALGQAHGFRDETQGTLFFDVARLIDQKKPAAFLLENVRNLVSHDGGRTFAVILRVLEEDLGYHVRYSLINASALVPQNRVRIYIAGFKSEVAAEAFAFPEFRGTPPVLGDILQTRVPAKYRLSDHLWQYLQEYKRKHSLAGHGFGFGLADRRGQTRTLSARYYKDGSEILVPVRGGNPRRLTPRECARLMGYPDSYRIVVSDTQAYKQFGNAVAVPVVREIGRAIFRALAVSGHGIGAQGKRLPASVPGRLGDSRAAV